MQLLDAFIERGSKPAAASRARSSRARSSSGEARMVIRRLRARADLKAIHDYIAKDSRQNAKRVAREIRGKAEALPEPPHVGRKVPGVLYRRRPNAQAKAPRATSFGERLVALRKAAALTQQQLEQSIARYLADLDRADRDPSLVPGNA